MTQPYKVCPQCNIPAALDARTCTHCGRAYRTQFAPPAQQTQVFRPVAAGPLPSSVAAPVAHSVPRAFGFVCTFCGNEQVQKVSSIVQSGQWSGVTEIQTVGYATDFQGDGMMMYGGGTAVQQGSTHLAALLSPPAAPPFFPPEEIRTRNLFAGMTVGCALGALCFLQGEGGANVAALFFLIVGAVCACIAIHATLKCPEALAQAEYFHDQRIAAHQQRLERWGMLWYCPRCNHVYHPQIGQAEASGNWQQVLLG